ncbi:MAG: Gldg family protein [Treponema sp.]|nr:Gldg family protein [Treponema sp.]
MKFERRFVSAASIIACAVFLFLVNLVFSLLAEKYPALGIDLTRNKLFKLSADTADFLKAMEKNVTIYVLAREDTFADTGPYNAQANQVFRQFEKNGPSVSLVYVDYLRNPAFPAAYPDLAMKHGDILVTCDQPEGTRHVLVKTEELFNYAGSRPENLSISSSRAEEAVYSAILQVTSGRPLRAAVLYGHGEYAIDAFASVLEKNNYEISRISLTEGAVDPLTDIVMAVAPRDDFGEGELKLLDEFLYNGGSYGKTLFYCSGAEQPELPNIAVFLREWGIAVEDGVVFETNERRVYNYQPFYAVADYAEEEFSSLLRTTAKPMLVPVSRPLAMVFDFRNNYSAKVLLEFAASAGVRPYGAPPEFTAGDALVRGPLPALVLGRYSVIDRSTGNAVAVSNVLVSGSAMMLDSLAVDNPAFSNTEYLVNVLNRLSARLDSIPLRPKSFTGAGLNLPRFTVNIIGAVFIAVIPLLILAAGIAVWIKRKHS